MGSLNKFISEYTSLLKEGKIQLAYKGIISFMFGLRTYLEKKHEGYDTSGIYQGYMDMTYFAFTPEELKSMRLKVAVVYLHKEARFELWLAAVNRQLQAEFVEIFSKMNIGRFLLSRAEPGVDAIISEIIVENPDFDNEDGLKSTIEIAAIKFIEDVKELLKK